MTETVTIRIIGAPIACQEGTKNTWREVAAWAARQLALKYGDSVLVQYFDLFYPGCPPLPDGAQLPLVLVNNRVVSSGGKISIPLIRMKLEEDSDS